MTVHNYYCCNGRGCRRCRPSRPWFSRWNIAFVRYTIRNLARLRAENRKLTKRIDALESMLQTNYVLVGDICYYVEQYARPCTHTCEAGDEPRNRYPWSLVLGILGAFCGFIGAALYLPYLVPSELAYDADEGIKVLSMAAENFFRTPWFTVIVLVGGAIGICFGAAIDGWRNRRNRRNRRAEEVAP